jgi:eukaryotic-like serine/threonine-protein kinase
MGAPKRIKSRYEIKDVLGRGGMGVVYRALDMDPSMRGREVALKTILQSPDQAALELFEKERLVLASLNHPNLIDIFDSGEFEENGERKPFFVMPLLRGQALDQLIRNASHRLTVERVVEIFTQACRGLHAAHERGLVHRDLKPSNIFVLNDDSVKIIDFGVAHMVDNRSSRGQKGTLLYMSPEQLAMKPVAASSDIFSLGVVCYEALTQRRPFDRATQSGVFEAILHYVPPPVSELNPAVSGLVSRVIHKAMAKQAWHRFSSAREFAETLQKALRNEGIEIFEAGRIRPRLERIKKAFEQGDYEYAGEILTELEAEGHVEPEMGQWRRRLNQAVLQKRTRQLLETARTRFEEGEDPLALQKVEEALELDQDNVEALTLKARIEGRRSERQIESWLSLAHQHLENRAYGHARQALQNVLQLRPQEGRATQLLAEVERDEQEYLKMRREKEQLYQAAQDAWQGGDVSTALEEMNQVMALDRRAPDTSSPERSAAYQSFYNQVRSDHDTITNAHAEARRHLAERNFEKALGVCDQYLTKYPQHALFKALKFEAQAQQRQALSAYIAEIDRRVEAESDLDKRLGVLREALAAYPQEPHFERVLKLMQEQHELVDSIVTKARLYEQRAQFTEALGQWEILRTIYERYPGLGFEIERVSKRRDQQSRSQAKARWMEQIDSRLAGGDYQGCLELVGKARTEFPNEKELGEIEKLARQGLERSGEAQQLLAQGEEACGAGRLEEGLELLRRSYQMDERNRAIRQALLENLNQQARHLLDSDWRAAERLAQEALELDPGHPLAKNIGVLVEDLKREEAINECITEVRRLQAANDLQGALAQVEQGLSLYAREDRLLQLRDTIRKDLAQAAPRQTRQRDLEELRRLRQEAELAADPAASRTICGTALKLAGRYSHDQEFDSLASIFRRRLETISSPTPGSVPPPPRENPLPSPTAVTVEVGSPTLDQVIRHEQATPELEGEDWRTAMRKHAENRRLAVPLATATLLAVGVLILSIRHWKKPHGPEVPSALKTQIALETNPPNAAIRIDGQDLDAGTAHVELTEGSHRIEAVKEGYQPLSQDVDVLRGKPTNVPLTLKPLSLKLQLFTNLEDTQIQLDGHPSGEVIEGKWVLENIGPGAHLLRLLGGRSEATVNFTAAVADVPAVSNPPITKNLRVVTVSTFGGRGLVQFGFNPVKISVDDQPRMDLKAGAIELKGLANGTHTLDWASGHAKSNFECDAAPVLAIFLELESASTTTSKPPRPTIPPEPATGARAKEIAQLHELALEAYREERYVEPLGESAIDYSRRVLRIDPADQQAKDMIDTSVKAQKSAVLRAVEEKNFAAAHRKADALKQQLPDRDDGPELEREVTSLENANISAHRPPSPEVRIVGIVDVYTTPAGRSVYIDGKYIGISPVLNMNVEAGTHRFSWDGACGNYMDTAVKPNEYTRVRLGCGTPQ